MMTEVFPGGLPSSTRKGIAEMMSFTASLIASWSISQLDFCKILYKSVHYLRFKKFQKIKCFFIYTHFSKVIFLCTLLSLGLQVS